MLPADGGKTEAFRSAMDALRWPAPNERLVAALPF